MTRTDFYLLLDEIMELPKGTMKQGATLPENWDSLAAVSFLAAVDEKFGLTIPSSKLDKVQSVDDLTALVGDKLTS